MANLDTEFKRASSVAINLYSVGPGFVFTSVGLSIAEMQVAGYGYYAISAQTPVSFALSELGIFNSGMVGGVI